MRGLGIIKAFLKRRGKSSKEIRKCFRNSEYEYLKQRVKLLEELLEEKSHSVEIAKANFLKNIYHEIRTPLNAIVGFSSLIELNDSDKNDIQRYYSYIKESSNEFLQKIDDIIEASIIEAGVVKITLRECVLFELLKELHTYYSIHKHLVEKEMAFLLTVPDELRKTKVLCDQNRIKQILGKLILNAFKYTDKGIVEFGFRIQKDEIEFFVKDTGIGGLEGKESIVFGSFTKIDESDTSPNGLGIGLSLSNKLVKIMNGRIWYDSTLSKGTTFYFTIPLKTVQLKKDDKRQKHNIEPIIGIKISSNQSVTF